MCGLDKVDEAVEWKWGWMWDRTTHLVHQTQRLSSNLFNQGTGINPWCNATVVSQASVTKYVKRDDVRHCHNRVTEFSLKGYHLGFKCFEIRAKNVGKKKKDLQHSCPALTLFLATFVWKESAFCSWPNTVPSGFTNLIVTHNPVKVLCIAIGERHPFLAILIHCWPRS